MAFKRWKCLKCQAKVLAFSEDINKKPINKKNLAWEKDFEYTCSQECNFELDSVQPDAVPVHGTTALMTEGVILDSVETTHKTASEAIQRDADLNEAKIVDRERTKK